jgi:hypothetical protein
MPARADRAKSVFLRAADLASAEERRAYVDGACAGDTALRREVEELLGHYGRLGAFLEWPAAPQPATGKFTPESASAGHCGQDVGSPEGPGTLVGPYKLLQPIGEGGMGAVFMAEQTRPVQRKVALKLIKPGLDLAQVVARFEAERQALALMDHPNIAKVFDGGATESGRPFFVMELVKGVPITKYCDEHQRCSSSCHWMVSGAGQRISTRSTASRSRSSLMSSPAMMVLPAPGSSANRKRRRGCGSIFWYTASI